MCRKSPAKASLTPGLIIRSAEYTQTCLSSKKGGLDRANKKIIKLNDLRENTDGLCPASPSRTQKGLVFTGMERLYSRCFLPSFWGQINGNGTRLGRSCPEQGSSSGMEQGGLGRQDSILHGSHSHPPPPARQHWAQVTFAQACSVSIR